jgi:hypothetical protein
MVFKTQYLADGLTVVDMSFTSLAQALHGAYHTAKNLPLDNEVNDSPTVSVFDDRGLVIKISTLDIKRRELAGVE